jgi:hypothetical protein
MSRTLLFVTLAGLAVAASAVAGPPARADRVAMKPVMRRPSPPPPRRDRVAKALARARSRHLDALRAYRKKGVFAHSLDRAGEVYVWKDADGRLDAVAALMASDSKDDATIVTAVAPQMVGVHLADMRYGDVYAWTLMSGFSQDEIDRLQRPHVRPAVVREGDDGWRADEDERLARSYGAVESYLRSHTTDGLEAATDELMAAPEVAWRLVDPNHKFPVERSIEVPEPDL